MKAVQRLTGLSADTLRAWEKRYQAVSPERNRAGRREYSPSEVQRLNLFASLVRAGRSISSITGLSNDELFFAAAPMQRELEAKMKRDAGITNILDCLKTFDMRALNKFLQQLLFEISPRDFIFYYVPQAMNVLNNLSEKGNISVSQEHRMSEIFGTYLRKIYEDLCVKEKIGGQPKTVLLCLLEGEHHELGLLISGIVCLQNGFNTIYLGPNLPMESLIATANSMQPMPHAILLSITQTSLGASEHHVESSLIELRRYIPKSCPIWLGGSGCFELRQTGFQKKMRIFESIEEFEQKIKFL